MNYQKIDAALAAALEETIDPQERSLAVFVFTTGGNNEEKAATLEDLGISSYYARRKIFTATLSPQGVENLTEEDWVRYLKLSRKLDLTPQEQEYDPPIEQDGLDAASDTLLPKSQAGY